MGRVEISEDDMKVIKYLFFSKVRSIERIQEHFKNKYTYGQIREATRKQIRGYNGYTR